MNASSWLNENFHTHVFCFLGTGSASQYKLLALYSPLQSMFWIWPRT